MRVIEEKTVDRIGGRAPLPVDVRIVAATSKDLKAAVAKGEFRGDLFSGSPYFRSRFRHYANAITTCCCWREILQRNSAKSCAGEATLSEALRALQAHDWPGNVRELENAIERACILTDTMQLEPKDLGLAKRGGEAGEQFQSLDLSGTLFEVTQRAIRSIERRKIVAALAANDNNRLAPRKIWV